MTAADGMLVVATVGQGRVASYGDRDTFVNVVGGVNIGQADNAQLATNLIRWLTGM